MNDDSNSRVDVIVPGERVFLGPLRRELLPEYRGWTNHLPAATMLGVMNQAPFPVTAEGVSEWYDEMVRSSSIAAFGVYEQGSHRAVGWVTLQGVKSRNRGAEFGIAIGELDARGRGYGTEATLLTLDYGFTVLGLHLIWLHCASINERAREVYRNVGFCEGGRVREAGQLGGRRHDAVFMDILASEFESPVLAEMLGISENA